jgi:uncharacterized lipoprotein YbaY
MPPEAVFEAMLEDVSKADTPAEVIGQTRIDWPCNPPFQFAITYDPAHINPSHRYTASARPGGTRDYHVTQLRFAQNTRTSLMLADSPHV